MTRTLDENNDAYVKVFLEIVCLAYKEVNRCDSGFNRDANVILRQCLYIPVVKKLSYRLNQVERGEEGLAICQSIGPNGRAGRGSFYKMQRFTHLPVTLFRIQNRLPVNLRSYDVQMAKGRDSFDLRLHNGLVLPLPPPANQFTTPNGMSLRPASPQLEKLVRDYRGNPSIYVLRCGLELPKHFCVFHEHSNHYSLQTTEPISLDQFNARLTEFLQTLPCRTREQFLELMADEDDQDG